MPVPKLFCTICGQSLEEYEVSNGFDPYTGDAIINVYKRCPDWDKPSGLYGQRNHNDCLFQYQFRIKK